ncbi:MAG: chorismate synthase, partial [Spirochaetes bacterium]
MNTFGSYFRTTTWGESHGSAIGTVIDGCPPGIDIKREDIQDELSRRRPGQTVFTSQRNEEDRVDILSGVFNGKTTGTPISLIIYNKDIRSSDYEKLKNIPRPGQADFTYLKKYGIRDYRGSGRASGRETASRVAAGAIAKKILFKEGIVTVGFSAKIGEVGIRNGSLITDYNISREEALKLRELIYKSPVRCPEIETSHKMEKTIQNISKEEDSLGGIIEILSYGVPPGLGSPVFDKLDALIAHAVMSVGAVKGVEIGEGFEIASKKGSTANDVFEF